MTRPTFPSDITPQQFGEVRDMLESSRRKTRPRKHDLYDVFCGLLYILRTGSSWRSLPPGFPPWRTVHEYCTQWSMPREGTKPLLQQALEQVGTAEDIKLLQKLGR